jgi:hypothetical protein
VVASLFFLQVGILNSDFCQFARRVLSQRTALDSKAHHPKLSRRI